MPWPTPQDYQEALQNPGLALADPELNAGRVELDPLGLPKPRTGGFASVYRVHCGQRDWAVRCFLRDFRDQQERYAAISDHLGRVRLPYTVDFTFLSQGILVRGQWYPILKMEWVEGERLDRYIERHLRNPSALLSLARRWIDMVKMLQQARVAHGDLQHGNVLVVQGDLRLIDYDGMFVPSLDGHVSHEVGHRNYQHPQRTDFDFGPWLDNFSAWVVYISLIALSVGPELWKRFGGGDECLLFRRQDFEQPDNSNILRALERSRDERIQSAATLFKSLFYLGPQQVPPLDGQVVIPSFPSERGIPDWLVDHVNYPLRNDRVQIVACAACRRGNRVRPHSSCERPVCGVCRAPLALPSECVLPASRPTVVDPSWIFDFLDQGGGTTASVGFKNSVLPERSLLTVSAIGAALAILISPTLSALNIVGLIAVVLINGLLWICRYRSEPAVAAFLSLQSNLRTIHKAIRATERDIKSAERKNVNLRNQADGSRAQHERKQKVVEAKERGVLEASQKALQSVRSSISIRRRTLQQQEATELGEIQNEVGAKVAAINQRIGAFTQAEANELTNALRNRQQQHIDAFLTDCRIESADIWWRYPFDNADPYMLQQRLTACGFQTAADIDGYRLRRVEGIGPKRAIALAAWRHDIELRARRSMPQSLPQNEQAAIRANYQGQRRTLEVERDRLQQRQRNEENALRERYAPEFQRLDGEEQSVQANSRRGIDEIRERYRQQYESLQESLSTLEKDTENELRKIGDRISEARKELFSLHWKKETAKRQLKALQGVHFPKYVARVSLGSRTA